MSNKEAVQKWRKSTKQRIIDSMGGKCQICEYNKCQEALELHHINPDEKEFGLGKVVANPKSWEKIVNELRKCILLCSNCHREVHADVISLPNDYQTFNESYVKYKKDESLHDECPICKGEKPVKQKTCSRNCAAKMTGKVDWKNIDLKELIEIHKTNTEIANQLNISSSAVRKRRKKLQL